MNESLNEIEKVFMAFGEKTRLRLLYLMRNGEVSVNFLCEALGTSQPKVSRHLAYLRSMGIVHTRRDGKWIFYSLNEPRSSIGSQLLRDTLAWIGASPEINRSASTAFLEAEHSVSNESGKPPTSDTYVNTDMWKRNDELAVYLL